MALENGDTGMGSSLRAVIRLSAYIGLTFLCMPLQSLALAFGWRLCKTLPQWYHTRCCRIMGFRVERRGRQSRAHPTLYLANHVSYFDIMILSALIPGVSFVAKAEVEKWPLFGRLARLQRTVFIDRRGRAARNHMGELRMRLEAGDNLVLFPEGTSSDGNRVLPFKSALLAAVEQPVEGQALSVQPVSIAYTRLDGLPMGRYLRPFFAWFGDMELAGHLWHAAGLGRATVVVEFHKPVTYSDFESRKDLGAHCQSAVAAGVADALSGRRRERQSDWPSALPGAAGTPLAAPMPGARVPLS